MIIFYDYNIYNEQGNEKDKVKYYWEVLVQLTNLFIRLFDIESD